MSWVITGSQKNNWTPAEITTALWLDAADASTVTLDSGTVSQWGDKSGNNKHATQGTLANRPSYDLAALNGKNVINWGSAINSKSLGASYNVSPARWYGVARWDGDSTFNSFNGLAGFNQATPIDVIYGNSGANVLFGSQSVFLNGSLNATNIVLPVMQNTFLFASSVTPNPGRSFYSIGYGAAADRGWRGIIAEILLLNDVPNLDTRQKIEGYLAHKWGLTGNLPADHPYKTAIPVP